jgi:hypothetical protein
VLSLSKHMARGRTVRSVLRNALRQAQGYGENWLRGIHRCHKTGLDCHKPPQICNSRAIIRCGAAGIVDAAHLAGQRRWQTP